MENVGNIDEERGDKAIVDTLLSDTFNSILRIEERSLKESLNRWSLHCRVTHYCCGGFA